MGRYRGYEGVLDSGKNKGNEKIVSISLRVPSSSGNSLDIEGVKRAAAKIKNLVEKGSRVIFIVRGGDLADEYAKVLRRYSKKVSSGEIESLASEVNSLFLIAALRKKVSAVNAAPVLDPENLEREFSSNPSWQVAVVASRAGSALAASSLARSHDTLVENN